MNRQEFFMLYCANTIIYSVLPGTNWFYIVVALIGLVGWFVCLARG